MDRPTHRNTVEIACAHVAWRKRIDHDLDLRRFADGEIVVLRYNRLIVVGQDAWYYGTKAARARATVRTMTRAPYESEAIAMHAALVESYLQIGGTTYEGRDPPSFRGYDVDGAHGRREMVRALNRRDVSKAMINMYGSTVLDSLAAFDLTVPRHARLHARDWLRVVSHLPNDDGD